MKFTPDDNSGCWGTRRQALPNPYRDPFEYKKEKTVLIEDLRQLNSGGWAWKVRSSDPDDAGNYRTGPDAKGLWKQYGTEYKLINGSFDLNIKGVKGKLEREFSK